MNLHPADLLSAATCPILGGGQCHLSPTETTWHATQKVKKNSDGTVALHFTVDGLDVIVWWVLGWSGRARVLKPAKLREMVVERLEMALTMNQEV